MEIPIFKPKLPITDELIPYLREIELQNSYSNFGPTVRKLESVLADYFKVDTSHIVTLCNATLALEGAIQSLKASAKWVSPSWTFTATNLALLRSGANFEFGDINDCWRLDEFQNFDAILDVCPFGDVVDFSRYFAHSGPVLIDAAASFPQLKDCGRDLLIQSNSTALVVSFHPTKILPGVEGGVFISNDVAWVSEVRSWSQYGFTSNSRISKSLGTNAKMNEFQAAVILSSLNNFEKYEPQWRRLHQLAIAVSQSLGLRCQPAMENESLSTYWILGAEKKLVDALESNSLKMGFQTRRWWGFGCHKMPVFSSISANVPHTEKISETTIGLPFHLHLDEHDFVTIGAGIERIGKETN